jgi:uncharacterized integral membrane protein
MWVVRAILIASIIVAVVAFAMYNVGAGQTVSVNFIWVRYVDVPLITVVFWSFVVGVVVAALLFVSGYIKLSAQLRAARRQTRALEHEVTVLRNRPIEESADLIKNSQHDSDQLKSPFWSE